MEVFSNSSYGEALDFRGQDHHYLCRTKRIVNVVFTMLVSSTLIDLDELYLIGSLGFKIVRCGWPFQIGPYAERQKLVVRRRYMKIPGDNESGSEQNSKNQPDLIANSLEPKCISSNAFHLANSHSSHSMCLRQQPKYHNWSDCFYLTEHRPEP